MAREEFDRAPDWEKLLMMIPGFKESAENIAVYKGEILGPVSMFDGLSISFELNVGDLPKFVVEHPDPEVLAEFVRIAKLDCPGDDGIEIKFT